MTRPKVPDDKRIRTAQACESCKRRKQKCNGLQPCNTCTKRGFVCEYISQNGHSTSQGSSTAAGSSVDRRISVPESSESAAPAAKRLKISENGSSSQGQAQPSPRHVSSSSEPDRILSLSTPIPPPMIPGRDHETEGRSRQSTASGADEVAEVYTETRMLQDPTGRLLYLGDSATLSYLQFIRMIVESVDGPSQFTMDPSRHRLMETVSTLPSDTRVPILLPDRKTADVLITSYFTNTNGLVEVFERNSFIRRLDTCYEDPLAAEPTFLCLLNLVFAIGLLLATPAPDSEEDKIIQKLHAGQTDRAELFYRSAKCLGDPTSGFEDADFWSVQALLLMSVYMLAKTKRNAAYAYHGMAVRSAYALGLHRLETMVIFPVPDRVQRRNVWRSLYVLDRFLAAALGRPISISEDDCSPDALVTPDKYLADNDTDASSFGGLNAAVRSCHVIGIILKKIYAQRKISARLAQDISEQCKGGPQKYNPNLHWRQAMKSDIDAKHGMTILHVNLLYCHAVILLTRPFFLFLMKRLQQEKRGAPRVTIRPGSRMEKFSEACVNAAYHTVTLVYIGYESKYLPQRDPFIIHFLFAATLVVLSSEFASLHKNPAYSETFQKAMTVMNYCAKSDPQAIRLVYILTTFNHVVVRRNPTLTTAIPDPSSVPNTPTGAMSNSSNDPTANFFISHGTNASSSVANNNLGATAFPSVVSQATAGQPIQASAISPHNSSNIGNTMASPGGMLSATTPTTSVAGDMLSDKDWFHFDNLWDAWLSPPGGVGGPAPAPVADPTFFDETALNEFSAPVDTATSTYTATPGTGTQIDGRFNGGGGMVPLYPMMRFNE